MPSDHDDIEAAIVRVRAGDREAFRVVIAACEGQLRALVAAILPNLSTVDDVVQKTLVVAFYRLDQYQAGTSFMAWVATIARYQALNERRRLLAESQTLLEHQPGWRGCDTAAARDSLGSGRVLRAGTDGRGDRPVASPPRRLVGLVAARRARCQFFARASGLLEQLANACSDRTGLGIVGGLWTAAFPKAKSNRRLV